MTEITASKTVEAIDELIATASVLKDQKRQIYSTIQGNRALLKSYVLAGEVTQEQYDQIVELYPPRQNKQEEE